MRDEHLPRYHKVKQALLEKIKRNRYSPEEPFLTTREVCERFGVSTTTAVRAIEELVREGYLIRQRGRGTFVAERTEGEEQKVASIESRTIGCILNEIRGRHTAGILRGIEQVCRDAGYRLFLFDSNGSAQTEALNLKRAIDSKVAGLIVFPVEGDSNECHFSRLIRGGLPIVMVDRYYPSLTTDAVVPNNFDIGYRLTKCLIERGHCRIATIWGETKCTSIQDRLSGHRQALVDNGIPLIPELITLHSYDWQPQSKRREMLQSILEASYRPTAFLCSNGYTMALVASDLVKLGVKLFEDAELAGMDDVGPYDLLPLATVAAILPSFEMGSEAAKLLLARIEQNNSILHSRQLVLPVKIFQKESASVHLHATAREGA